MGSDQYHSYNLHAMQNSLIGVYHRISWSVVTNSYCSWVVAFKNLAASLYMYSTVQCSLNPVIIVL